jgi:hypothetical protein
MKVCLSLTYHEIGAFIDYTGLLHNTLLQEREGISGATIRKAELRCEILQLQELATRLFTKQLSGARHTKQTVYLTVGEVYMLFKYRNGLSEQAPYPSAVINIHIETFLQILLS